MANGVIIPVVDSSWTEITPSIVTTKISDYISVKAYKRNGLCIVDMRGLIFLSTGDSMTSCIIGLPKAICQSNCILSSSSSATTFAQIGNCGWINSGGTGINFHIRVNTDRCWGTLIYPCED